jgi:hypothetical protein
MAILATEIEIEPEPFAIVRHQLPANRRRDQRLLRVGPANLSDLRANKRTVRGHSQIECLTT